VTDLYERGMATAVACWQHFAAGTEGATVLHARGVSAAVFPLGPERAIYNNAVLERDLSDGGRRSALAAMEDAYRAAGVTSYAAWVHESDTAMIVELERRGYAWSEVTRAMAISLDDLVAPAPTVELREPSWPEYWDFLQLVDVPSGLLSGVDATRLDVVMATVDGTNVATGLSFDHHGDCGIFNVATLPWARRRGFGTALTAHLLHAARRRGCTTASLQSTPAAERLYTALGFEDLGRILEYAPRAGAVST